MPSEHLSKQSFKSTLETPRHRSLFWLDSLGLIISIAGIAYVIYFIQHFNPITFETNNIGTIAFGFGLIALGAFCFKSAHRLWGRFDFTSKFTWIEMSGNYQSAKMDYGNVINDHIKTEKNIINVENMTLRVWVCEVDSVTLDKGQPRYITAMRGSRQEADYLANHLIQFASNQSIVVTPDSQVDQQKLMSMSAMNNTQKNILDDNQKDAVKQYIASNSKATCIQCSSKLTDNAKFCGNCGIKLA